MVERSGKFFIFTNNLYIKKGIQLCFLISIEHNMLVYRPFRTFWKASKYSGEVNKTKISSTYHW